MEAAMAFPDITGKRFGKLIIVGFDRTERFVDENGRKRRTKWWKARCRCGKIQSFPRGEITGRKVSMCPECKARLVNEKWSNGGGIRGAQSRSRMENAPRNTVTGFVNYFAVNQLLFMDTFEKEYTEERAREEFNKIMIMGWEEEDGEDDDDIYN